jgi:phospholipid transport system transporter-binding protein
MVRLIPLGYNYWQLQGELTLTTITQLATVPQAWLIATDRPVMVDLAGVIKADSAALALLLDWLQQAHHAHCQLSFIGWPPALKRLAQLFGLDELIQCR